MPTARILIQAILFACLLHLPLKASLGASCSDVHCMPEADWPVDKTCCSTPKAAQVQETPSEQECCDCPGVQVSTSLKHRHARSGADEECPCSAGGSFWFLSAAAIKADAFRCVAPPESNATLSSLRTVILLI